MAGVENEVEVSGAVGQARFCEDLPCSLNTWGEFGRFA